VERNASTKTQVPSTRKTGEEKRISSVSLSTKRGDSEKLFGTENSREKKNVLHQERIKRKIDSGRYQSGPEKDWGGGAKLSTLTLSKDKTRSRESRLVGEKREENC